MATVQDKLKQLEREQHAMKIAFARSATKTSLVTKTISFATSRNVLTYAGDYTFTADGEERVVVTLDTSGGANTIAKLEISGDYDLLPFVRRVPYSGGARWVVSNAAKLSGSNWVATNYVFTVQTLVNGSLSARMIWS